MKQFCIQNYTIGFSHNEINLSFNSENENEIAKEFSPFYLNILTIVSLSLT